MHERRSESVVWEHENSINSCPSVYRNYLKVCVRIYYTHLRSHNHLLFIIGEDDISALLSRVLPNFVVRSWSLEVLPMGNAYTSIRLTIF